MKKGKVKKVKDGAVNGQGGKAKRGCPDPTRGPWCLTLGASIQGKR